MHSRRFSALCLSALVLTLGFSLDGTAAIAKGKKRARAQKSYFVPPPPPYTPSLAPRLNYGYGTTTTEAKAPAKPTYKYKEYVYNKEGYEPPKPTQPNPYVTYWGG